MKTTTLLLAFACGTILFSCNSNTGQKSVDNLADTTKTPTVDNKLAQYEDSIKKADALAIELFRQDSIEALQIKGYSANKISGKHKYGGVTKVEYTSPIQLLDEIKKMGEKEMWTKDKIESTLESYKSTCKGGRVRLYIERTTIGSANTEDFSIIIKDKSENELYRLQLDSDVPDYSSDNWWNYGYACVDKRIKPPFFVYIVDRLEDAPFKFEVKAIKK